MPRRIKDTITALAFSFLLALGASTLVGEYYYCPFMHSLSSPSRQFRRQLSHSPVTLSTPSTLLFLPYILSTQSFSYPLPPNLTHLCSPLPPSLPCLLILFYPPFSPTFALFSLPSSLCRGYHEARGAHRTIQAHRHQRARPPPT